MKKNNLTFIWEGRRERKETKNSLPQVLERSWGEGVDGAWKGAGQWGGTGGLHLFTLSHAGVRRRVSPEPLFPLYLIGHRGGVSSTEEREGSDSALCPPPQS